MPASPELASSPVADPGSREPGATREDTIHLAENMAVLPTLADGSFQLIYIDPPFNTGKPQSRRTLKALADPNGDRAGFQGRRYRTRLLNQSSYRDAFEDYLA